MENFENEPTLEELKKQFDIVSVAEMYGKLVKSGSNYIYKHDKSISISPSKQIFSDFNGSITGGSVLDLICYMENLSITDGIKRLKELAGTNLYIPQKRVQSKNDNQKKEVDFRKLDYFAKQELKVSRAQAIAQVVDEHDNLINIMITGDGFRKLFETSSFEPQYYKKLDYLFNNIIGYNKFFRCPSIILKDDSNRIVDIIAYRPIKPDHYKEWSNPKYIYKNASNRGDNFLYPFRKEVEYIIKKENYIIVGEGIKNGLNALIYSVPFITLESSSNKMSQKLIDYIRAWIDKGYNIITMFDGDEAGKKAYERFKEQTGLQVDNFLDFNSGLDFVDYLQSEDR